MLAFLYKQYAFSKAKKERASEKDGETSSAAWNDAATNAKPPSECTHDGSTSNENNPDSLSTESEHITNKGTQ